MGFLSLPEDTRSLQATERKRGREGQWKEERMERKQETRREQDREEEHKNQDKRLANS